MRLTKEALQDKKAWADAGIDLFTFDREGKAQVILRGKNTLFSRPTALHAICMVSYSERTWFPFLMKKQANSIIKILTQSACTNPGGSLCAQCQGPPRLANAAVLDTVALWKLIRSFLVGDSYQGSTESQPFRAEML